MSVRNEIRKELRHNYNAFESSGYSLFTVTLSTYIKSRSFAKGNMRDFWNDNFIGGVKRRLPFKVKNKFDHYFIVEISDEGHFHYHGLMALPPDAAQVLWRNDALNTQLKRDLDSFRNRGKHRPFCVNTHKIEPVISGCLDTWIKYMTKSDDIPLSSTH